MKCPKCGHGLWYGRGIALPIECSECRWSSGSIEAMIESSPAYRLAKLKAEGKRGWFGPDGEAAELDFNLVTGEVYVCNGGHSMTVDEAVMFGFVEVTDE